MLSDGQFDSKLGLHLRDCEDRRRLASGTVGYSTDPRISKHLEGRKRALLGKTVSPILSICTAFPTFWQLSDSDNRRLVWSYGDHN